MNHVERLRSFNRSFTQRIGVLDESFLGTGRPLGESRLLFEVGPGGAGVLELRTRLGLDSGYLSRLLRRLEVSGLVEVRDDPDDGRRRLVRLTDAGRSEWEVLDRRSDALAEQLLAPLGDDQRSELSECLARAERLVRAATLRFEAVDPTDARATHALTTYGAELEDRFPTGFLGAELLTSGLDGFAPPNGAFVVASTDGATIACGGLARHDDTSGELKRMWVDRAWRGLGLGRRMLVDLEARAADTGYRRVVLDTNLTLTEAIALYESSGYAPIERYNDNPDAQAWFAKELVA